MKKVKAYCLGEKFNLKKLEESIEKYSFTKFKDFLFINQKNLKTLIFPYWVIISWNNSYDFDKEILDRVRNSIINPHKSLEESYFFEENEKFKIINDNFYVPNNDNIIISISYALSQSIKLNYFEDEIEKEILKTKNIPIEIKKYWKSKLSQKEILKLRGELMLTKSLLNLHYDLLDEPEFFWDHPELVSFYETTQNYLDIKDRIEIANKKINVIDEIFETLSDEVKYKHETFLERVIIWLIVIEVVIAIFNEVSFFIK